MTSGAARANWRDQRTWPEIPGLPVDWRTGDGALVDLSRVPPGATGPDDPDTREKRDLWEIWALEAFRFRVSHQKRVLVSEELQREELHRCKVFGAPYFIAVWCSIYEPRTHETPLGGGWMPAIPFGYQVEVLHWLDRRIKSEGAAANGVLSKSRDMGATWYVCLWSLYGMLFESPFSVKFISRKEELVDQRGDLDSMMERIAAHLVVGDDSPALLPAFLRPKKWRDAVHRKSLYIANPDNGNMLKGESTNKNAGRGGRALVAIPDEASFIANLNDVLGSLQMTAAHIIAISSESVETTEDFVEYRDKLKKIESDAVFEADYWLHPFHDARWLALQRERFPNEIQFAREILRQARAGFSGWYYDIAQSITVEAERIEYLPGNPLYVGIDPGDADDCALHWVMLDGYSGWDTLLESYERSGPPPEHFAAIILGCDPDQIEALIPALKFGAVEREVMAWTATLPQPIICGDPSGKNKVGGDSWYGKMQRFSLAHNPRKTPHGPGESLRILMGWNPQSREHPGRRASTVLWLPRLRFNPTPEVERTLYAIQRSRVDHDESKPRAIEQIKPLHDALSHRRSALEFLAVNIDMARMQRGRTGSYEANKGTRTPPKKRSA